MVVTGRSVAALLLGLTAAVGPAAVRPARSTGVLTSSVPMDAAYDRGIARVPGGWIVSGRDVLARLDEQLVPQRRLDPAIPPAWSRRGYDQLGDVDVAGTTLYVPFERADHGPGHQVMARYDARTLRFRDAEVVDQHENSFVAVNGESGIAYSMDHLDGDALTRYDVRAGWRPLAPLHLDRTLQRVRGAAYARGALWLSTDDARNGVYRVDPHRGTVSDIGSATPVAGEGQGIDAATVTSEELHVVVLRPDRGAVALDNFHLTDADALAPEAARPSTTTDTSWPPALAYFGVALLLVGVGAVGTVFWRARRTIHDRR